MKRSVDYFSDLFASESQWTLTHLRRSDFAARQFVCFFRRFSSHSFLESDKRHFLSFFRWDNARGFCRFHLIFLGKFNFGKSEKHIKSKHAKIERIMCGKQEDKLNGMRKEWRRRHHTHHNLVFIRRWTTATYALGVEKTNIKLNSHTNWTSNESHNRMSLHEPKIVSVKSKFNSQFVRTNKFSNIREMIVDDGGDDGGDGGM